MPGPVSRSPSRPVVIAALDDDFDIDHPALNNQLWTNPREIAGDGIDNDGDGFIDDLHGTAFTYAKDQAVGSIGADPRAPTPWAGVEHGTGIASLIAGTGSGPTAAPGPVEVMCLSYTVSQDVHLGFERAVDYVIARKQAGENVRVANASMSVGTRNPATQAQWAAAVQKLAAADILLVCAASNDGVPIRPGFDLPAGLALPNVITVGALDPSGQTLAPYSDQGADLAASGQNEVALPNLGWAVSEGTSGACALVSRALGLYFAAYPDATSAQARAALLASTRGPLAGTRTGALDLERFLKTPPA